MARSVYAIRYAERAAARSDHFYGGDTHEGPMPMAYFTWVVIDDDAAVVVDTGFSPRVAARRPGRELVADPAEVLARLGVDVADVRDVVLTHLHFDHAGGLDRYPRARFWVQDAEMAFWTGRHAGRAGFAHTVEPDDVAMAVRLNFDLRLAFVDGDAEVAPGVGVHRVGGHSAGLQAVAVQAESGVVVLASDAAHFYENLEQDRPFPSIHSLAGMYTAFDRLHELAGRDGVVVPGHDPAVLERFPAVPGLEGIAVRLG
ncbi:MAG TPA: N-acyl homoserine lactonase family protein [Baekduia sp.]|nr:N-acyl homoserine lactonase family protein [Baekduia sp.]